MQKLWEVVDGLSVFYVMVFALTPGVRLQKVVLAAAVECASAICRTKAKTAGASRCLLSVPP
jgi:hypothetical protein